MKVYFLSVSTYSDNQVELLLELSKYVEITYGVIFPHLRANYSEPELRQALSSAPSIKVETFQQKRRFRDPRLIAGYYQIIKSIRKAKPDIIYYTNFDQIYINALLTLLDKKKTIISFHDVENHSNTKLDLLTNVAKKILMKSFRNFQTYSLLQEKIFRRMEPAKKVFTIPLTLINFGPALVQKRGDGITTFLFFGNILSYKGLDILLRSVARVARQTNRFRLTIAGRSNDWEQVYEPLMDLPEIKNNPGLVDKQVRFIANEEIPVFFTKADYLVLPYRDTTQSGPLMIAYNYNVPVIASNAEGFKEFIIPGKTGLSFDLADEHDLDRVLLEAIHSNPENYDGLKKSQKEFVDSHFSISVLAKKYMDMFNDVNRSLA